MLNKIRIMKKLCKTCSHWKNQQAELGYSQFSGICTCYKWKFETTNYSDVCVLDRGNITDKHMGVSRFESQNKDVPIGKAEKSRYLLVTSEKFGCIHHAI